MNTSDGKLFAKSFWQCFSTVANSDPINMEASEQLDEFMRSSETDINGMCILAVKQNGTIS